MYERALRGYEKALGDQRVKTYPPTLNTLENLGILMDELGRPEEALVYYTRAADGVEKVYGAQSQRHQRHQRLVSKLQRVN
jgi:tetratricopeptide (TPR) repeat protein